MEGGRGIHPSMQKKHRRRTGRTPVSNVVAQTANSDRFGSGFFVYGERGRIDHGMFVIGIRFIGYSMRLAPSTFGPKIPDAGPLAVRRFRVEVGP